MCSHVQATPSVAQTLDELDFERGLWSAANDNDLKRCRELIQKGTTLMPSTLGPNYQKIPL